MKKDKKLNKIYHFIKKETKIKFQIRIILNQISVLSVQNDIFNDNN
jgi:hypothetical protein